MERITKKYRLIIALTAVICLVALLLAANYNLFPFVPRTRHTVSQAPVTLTAVPVGTVNKSIYIVRTGSTESSESVPVNAAFSGLLSELYVTAGQAVKAGQPLFTLQGSSEAAGNQTAGVSPQAQANYDNALKEYNRYQKLFEIGGIPRRQMEMAAARLQEAKESLNSTQSSSVPINGSATINAPIDGIVTAIAAALGQGVQAGQQLISLGSGQEVEVVVHLDQNDLYLVHLGTPATIDISQQSIAGQVCRIYPQVEANQIPSFLAHTKLTNNPAGLLKSGMSVNVRIDTGRTAVVPAVPAASVLRDDHGQNFIYLAANGKAAIQPISIGETIGDFTEITSDLPEQSLVITTNINDIKDGDAITVMQ
ncbi:MAG TPA: efflux RND transporter periplasmic adaptor subunit [Methylomusa anaerophila]|uniref:Nickel and cobalt resistance protein CnrB n=1 Tax=Methylomusa anaerophila TaxID=1930071 RepID=A0A348ALB0_9FIRM|nr:efflux RND transporter periplasmic adaptor subunit [Methylomusa anaerophila]BBB91858.1 nickel and cobalt resistance protein CnrB [Methylomusa anaerophila]HML88410.1 efflux RND transporter periplasmic adaptor subunit [Methylomusa anaerophila]